MTPEKQKADFLYQSHLEYLSHREAKRAAVFSANMLADYTSMRDVDIYNRQFWIRVRNLLYEY